MDCATIHSLQTKITSTLVYTQNNYSTATRTQNLVIQTCHTNKFDNNVTSANTGTKAT